MESSLADVKARQRPNAAAVAESTPPSVVHCTAATWEVEGLEPPKPSCSVPFPLMSDLGPLRRGAHRVALTQGAGDCVLHVLVVRYYVQEFDQLPPLLAAHLAFAAQHKKTFRH